MGLSPAREYAEMPGNKIRALKARKTDFRLLTVGLSWFQEKGKVRTRIPVFPQIAPHLFQSVFMICDINHRVSPRMVYTKTSALTFAI